jgi:hypothetical protein
LASPPTARSASSTTTSASTLPTRTRCLPPPSSPTPTTAAPREETQISAPFDLEAAPISDRGYFIGDYVALAADGRDFVTAFPITNELDLTNRTDVVAVRAEAP